MTNGHSKSRHFPGEIRRASRMGTDMVLIQNPTSWDELSSHQAEAVSLNLASSYGYPKIRNLL